MNAGRSLFRDGALVGSSALAVNASTFIFYAAAVRSLGVSASGALLAIVATTLVLSVPSVVSGVALGTESSRLLRDGRFGDLRQLSSWFIVASLCASFGVVAGGIGAMGAIQQFFGDITASTAVCGIVLLAVMLPGLALRGMLQGVNAINLFVSSNLVECVGRLSLSLFLLMAPRDLQFALAGLAMTFASVSIVGISGVVTRTGFRMGASAQLLRETFAGAGPTLLTIGSLTLLSSFDSVAARHFLSARDSGYYNAAALAGRALMTALAFVPAFAMPKLSSTFPGSVERRIASRQLYLLGTFVCAASATGFLLFPQIVIRIIAGPTYIDAAPVVATYGIASSALALATIISSIELVRGPSKIMLFVCIAAVIEFCAVCLYHPSPAGLAWTVASGHCLVLISCIVGSRIR